MKDRETTNDQIRQELVKQIGKLVKLHSIYILGEQIETTTHRVFIESGSGKGSTFSTATIYTLLLVTMKPIPERIGDLMDNIHGRMNGSFRVCLINHSLSNMKKRLDHGDPFLRDVLIHGICIHRKDDKLIPFSRIETGFHERIYLDIRNSWTNRMKRADYLLRTVDMLMLDEDADSRLIVMHQAMVQICLALLMVFWEYRPHHCSLSYLLHLCGHFTELPKTIFLRDTYGSHRLYYMLCNINHIILFKSLKEFSDNNAEKLLGRCKIFHGQANEIGQQRLRVLKEIHCGENGKDLCL